MKKGLVITGETLTPAIVADFVRTEASKVSVSPSALKKIKAARVFLDKNSDKQIIYGVNTGYGPMVSRIIGKPQLEDLQLNLIRSHAVGAGDPIKEEYVLASMLDRLNTFAKGYSGVSTDLVERLVLYINHKIIPVVPEHGAVGTSGDLVQMAHVALGLIGEGDVFYKGKRQSAASALKKAGLAKDYTLKPKEGIAMINATSTMTGISSLLVSDAKQALDIALRAGTMGFELVRGFTDVISEELHEARPHKGQVAIAAQMRKLLKSSELLNKRADLHKRVELEDDVYKTPEHIQEVYSLRCIPQILGPISDILEKVTNDVETELNSVSDNPLVDLKNRQFLHGGNFHGDYIATAVDQLKISLVKMTMLSERRTNFFMSEKTNEMFTPFLNLNKPGLTLGLQGVQFVATSTTAQNQSFAFPHSVHSISTNAENQDVVSMGTDAALIGQKVLDNLYIVLAIELITLAQAVDVLQCKEKLSKASQELYENIREIFPAVTKDRSFTPELMKLAEHIRGDKKLRISSK
tara:strand:- start:163465 stop:165033 length:1569 start_codon:yes stop_codon:yes gene_type:complete